jgi:hypothetical protein
MPFWSSPIAPVLRKAAATTPHTRGDKNFARFVRCSETGMRVVPRGSTGAQSGWSWRCAGADSHTLHRALMQSGQTCPLNSSHFKACAQCAVHKKQRVSRLAEAGTPRKSGVSGGDAKRARVASWGGLVPTKRPIVRGRDRPSSPNR